MTLYDFSNHASCRLAGLQPHHVFALRAYTSDSYPFFNNPLRQRVKPHPLMFTIFFLDQALKMLTTVEAQLRPSEFNKVTYLWRGMKNMTVDTEAFFAEGGSELAPMSTTNDRNVALKYSESDTPLIFCFEARGRSRGVDIGFLSLYPKEKEFLYAPLTGLVLLSVEEKLESQLSAMQQPVPQSLQSRNATSRKTSVILDMQRLQEELKEIEEVESHAAAGHKTVCIYHVRPMR